VLFYYSFFSSLTTTGWGNPVLDNTSVLKLHTLQFRQMFSLHIYISFLDP